MHVLPVAVNLVVPLLTFYLQLFTFILSCMYNESCLLVCGTSYRTYPVGAVQKLQNSRRKKAIGHDQNCVFEV